MPLTRLVCPHCEQSVEVQMTSVTRSRECPGCGKTIILQTTARDGRQSRKALLMPRAGAGEGEESAGVEAAGTFPRILSGDPRERMLLDPEVRRTAARLKWGLAFFGGLLLGVLLWHSLHLGSLLSQAMTRSESAPRTSPEAAAANPDSSLPAAKSGGKTQAESDPGPPSIPDAPTGPELTDQQQAQRAVIVFLKAATVEERLNRVRDRRLNEERIRNYYTRMGAGPVAYERVEPLEINPAGPLTYSFTVVLPDGARRMIMMGKSQSGEYMADWASFVLYSEMSWKDFRAQRPQKPTMFRVLAEPGALFGHDFNDPEALSCFKLLDPIDSEAKPIYGYATKSSSTGRALKFVMEKSPGQQIPLILKLSYPENSSTEDQVWVTEFIGEGWIARNW